MRAARLFQLFGEKIAGTIWERATLAQLCRLLATLLALAFGVYCLADLILNQRALSKLTPYFLLEHYACHIIKRLPKLMPLCTFLCALGILSKKARRGEWTALQSSGISFWQISIPFLRFGLISCFCSMAAFEALYPVVASTLRIFEERPQQLISSPHILFLDREETGLQSCVVFWNYRDCAQKDSSGIFSRGFFCPKAGDWIYFDTLQFLPGYAQLRNAICWKFGDKAIEAKRAKTVILPIQIDLKALVRQTLPAEDLSLWQLSKERGKIPRNATAGAYFHYRLIQLLAPLWSIYLAFALFSSSGKWPGAGSAFLGILILVSLDALWQIGVILCGFHLMRPLWLWIGFLPPIFLWSRQLKKL